MTNVRSFGAVAALAATAGLAIAPAKATGGPPAKQVVWRDSRGVPVPVVALDCATQTLHLLDGHNQIWSYDYMKNVVAPYSPGLNPDGTNTFNVTPTILYFQSSDCTGPSYITPFPSGATVGAPRDPAGTRVIPNNVAFTTINTVSLTQGIQCEDGGSTPLGVIRFDTLPHAQARGNLGTVPFHPEAIRVDD